jgi:lipid-A-disaccharide synthase
MILAGEASGDLHGSGVVRALRELSPGVEVFGMGGDHMRAEGMDVLVDIRKMAFMGFVEVARNLRTVFDAERVLGDAMDQCKPESVLLIDYPGFNLRFARRARKAGVAVFYYISPQVWAWHKSRVHTIRERVDRMHVIFPFEESLFREAGVPVTFVGHPLVERLELLADRAAWLRSQGFDPERPVLGLFPGSRTQEIERILPAMVKAARRLAAGNACQIGLGRAAILDRAVIDRHVPADAGIRIVENATHELMQCSTAALVTSGTATLEVGWYGTPFVVVYRTSPATFAIGRRLVQVKHIGLVNIVAGRTLVPELVQGDCTPERMVQEVGPMLFDRAVRDRVHASLGVIRERLGGPGASRRVAESILSGKGSA